MRTLRLWPLMAVMAHSAAIAFGSASAMAADIRELRTPEGKLVVVVSFPQSEVQVRVLSPRTDFSLIGEAFTKVCDDLTSKDRVGEETDAARATCLQHVLLSNRSAIPAGLFLKEYSVRSSADVVVSGGYLASFSPPEALGYVKSNGQVLSKAHKSWLVEGMLCANDKGATIVEFNLEETDSYKDCVQSGPMLVKEGVPKYSSLEGISASELKFVRSVQEQVFLCTGPGETFTLGFSEEMRLHEVSSFIATELQCDQAIRMTGHETAGLALPDKVFGYSEYPLPNAVAAFSLAEDVESLSNDGEPSADGAD